MTDLLTGWPTEVIQILAIIFVSILFVRMRHIFKDIYATLDEFMDSVRESLHIESNGPEPECDCPLCSQGKPHSSGADMTFVPVVTGNGSYELTQPIEAKSLVEMMTLLINNGVEVPGGDYMFRLKPDFKESLHKMVVGAINELYDHRCHLFCLLMGVNNNISWRSRLHEDGTMFEGGWFVAGINLGGDSPIDPDGKMITYHMEERYWPLLDNWGIAVLENAPKWDGHTAGDVLTRISEFMTGADGPPQHRGVDDYILDFTMPQALQAFILVNRLPAMEKNILTEVYGYPELYCCKVDDPLRARRVVMASRMGDLGITLDLLAKNGYESRVLVHELQDFTNDVKEIVKITKARAAQKNLK